MKYFLFKTALYLSICRRSAQFVLFSLIFLILAISAEAQDLRAPILGAASNFQFGPQRGKMERLSALDIRSLRDGLRWRDVERTKGSYDFTQGSGQQIAALSGQGLLGSVTLHPLHPMYDGGQTITSDAGIAAFANYVAAVADRFPALHLEIANEFNGRSFVSGAAREMSSDQRAQLHARMLSAIAATGRVPAHRIIGGAAHSVPGAYFAQILAMGAGAHMGALTIHPYSSTPEALPRQIEAIQTLLDMKGIALEITEYGHSGDEDPSLAADKFWKGYCAAGLAEVRRFVWYPLEQRRDGYVSVLGPDTQVTPMGRAYLYANEKLEQRALQELWPTDDAVRGCQFGARTAVIWGAPRKIEVLRSDLTLHNADMSPLDVQRDLDRTQVVVVTVPDTAPRLKIPRDLRLGATALIADTQDSWGYPEVGPDQEFSRFLERRGSRLPLYTCLGQNKNGVPWVPYLCNADVGRAVLTDRDFVLGGSDQAPVSLVHRYIPKTDTTVVMKAQIGMSANSSDGVVLQLVIDGKQVASRPVTGTKSVTFAPFAVKQGSAVDIRISPGRSTKGDFGTYRLNLYDGNHRDFGK